MDIANIVRNHVTAPFTLPVGEENKATQLTTLEKTISLALSILIGFYTAGIGGAITFYLTTAIIKAIKLTNQPPDKDTESNPVLSSRTNRILDTLGKSAPYPQSIQDRRFPPISVYDTIIVSSHKVKSHHSNQHLFYKDEEIITLHPSKEEITLNDQIKADLMANGKVVIQQQAQRSCTAAAAAMLIYDARKTINVSSLSSTNLGNTDKIKSWISAAQLTSRVTHLEQSNLLIENLCTLIKNYGPAIVSTNNDIGNHVIVVDEINLRSRSVYLRDPYHGWAIAVKLEAFLRGFTGDDIIQVEP